MDLKAVLFILACFLLLNTKGGAIDPPKVLVSKPPPPLPIKSSPPPPPVKFPPPPPPPANASPPPPLVYKAPPPPPPPRTLQDCIPLCKVRCKKHNRQNVCMRACSTCCLRCKCVPPGQYGNKEKCQCYANMTTKGGKPKCP